MREVTTATAPSAWASYYVNGDTSGLTDAEIAAADGFAEHMGGAVVDCEEDGFRWYHDARTAGFAPYGADCQLYTFHLHQ